MNLPATIDPETDLGLPFENATEVADPNTDVSATFYETLCITVAAMSHTAPRAWAIVSAAASGSTTGVLLRDHDAMWGDTNAVKPTVTRTATGAYTVAWAASYQDLNPTPARVVTTATNLRTCSLQRHDAGRGWASLSGNTVSVTLQGVGGTAANGTLFTVFVY